MNSTIKRLAKKAGFCFWNGESWAPPNAEIDWSCIYDKEFQKYTELLLDEIIERVYTDPELALVQKVSFENKMRKHFGVE